MKKTNNKPELATFTILNPDFIVPNDPSEQESTTDFEKQSNVTPENVD